VHGSLFSFNEINRAFNAQYKTVILALLIYILSGLGLGLEGYLPDLNHWLGFVNAGIEPIPGRSHVTL